MFRAGKYLHRWKACVRRTVSPCRPIYHANVSFDEFILFCRILRDRTCFCDDDQWCVYRTQTYRNDYVLLLRIFIFVFFDIEVEMFNRFFSSFCEHSPQPHIAVPCHRRPLPNHRLKWWNHLRLSWYAFCCRLWTVFACYLVCAPTSPSCSCFVFAVSALCALLCSAPCLTSQPPAHRRPSPLLLIPLTSATIHRRRPVWNAVSGHQWPFSAIWRRPRLRRAVRHS